MTEANTHGTPESGTETKRSPEEALKVIRETTQKIEEKSAEVLEALRESRGRFRLETPIQAGDTEITELTYDFPALTGMEYADAMDSDSNAQAGYRITSRQALALFAKSAAKYTDHRLDMKDILEKIGVTDAVQAVQLATLFFNGSTRAGRMRISRKS